MWTFSLVSILDVASMLPNGTFACRPHFILQAFCLIQSKVDLHGVHAVDFSITSKTCHILKIIGTVGSGA